MPLKITSNTRGFQLVWSSPDEGMEASWKILNNEDEDAQLDKMEKALRFIRQQRGEIAAAVSVLEKEIRGETVAVSLPTADGAQRIVMGPPLASDLPAGGLPVNGWAALAGDGRNLPDYAKEAGWEMIPADER